MKHVRISFKCIIVQCFLKKMIMEHFLKKIFLTANISGLKITLSFAINSTDSNALDLPGPENGK